MTSRPTPRTLTWLTRTAWAQIILNLIVIVYLIYLSLAQPEGGWRSGFNLGFLEGVTGEKDVVFFTMRDAGRAATLPVLLSLIDLLVLFGIDKKKYLWVRNGLIANVALALLNFSIPLLGIIMLLLATRKEVREYLS
jgi:hypothetical protein